jgi:hypothetical protein
MSAGVRRDISLVQVSTRVKTIFEEGGLSISTFAIALQSGSIGDVVRVRNLDSGLTISGRRSGRRHHPIAVLINRASLTASLGDKATPDAVDKQLLELEKLISTAAGVRKDRGDSIKLTAVDFIDPGHDLEPVSGPGIVEILAHQTGTAVSALAIVGVALLLMWFGLRPMELKSKVGDGIKG